MKTCATAAQKCVSADRKKFVQLLFRLGIQLPTFTNQPTGVFAHFYFRCTAFAFLETCARSANEAVKDILSNSYLFILLPLGSSETSLRLSRPADLHHHLQGSLHHIFGLRAGIHSRACMRVSLERELKSTEVERNQNRCLPE